MINDWRVAAPQDKKSRRKKATLVEPEETETDEDSLKREKNMSTVGRISRRQIRQV